MNRPGTVGRTRRGSVRVVALLAALLFAVLTAGCGSDAGADEAAAKGDDRGDLTELVYRFYDYMEKHRFDDLDQVLDAKVVAKDPGGGPIEGRDNVVANVTAAAKQEDRTQHVITNVIVDVTGDKAKVQAAVEQLFGSSTTPKGKIAPEPTMTLSSTMHFESVRTAQGWRISRIDGDLLWATQK
jgi:hypothetical protein